MDRNGIVLSLTTPLENVMIARVVDHQNNETGDEGRHLFPGPIAKQHTNRIAQPKTVSAI